MKSYVNKQNIYCVIRVQVKNLKYMLCSLKYACPGNFKFNLAGQICRVVILPHPKKNDAAFKIDTGVDVFQNALFYIKIPCQNASAIFPKTWKK